MYSLAEHFYSRAENSEFFPITHRTASIYVGNETRRRPMDLENPQVTSA